MLQVAVGCSSEKDRATMPPLGEDFQSNEARHGDQRASTMRSKGSRETFNGVLYESFNERGQRTALGYAEAGTTSPAFRDVLRYQSLTLLEQLDTESPIAFMTPTALSGWYEEYDSVSGEEKKVLRVEFAYGMVSRVQIWQEDVLVMDSHVDDEGRYRKLTRIINNDDGSLRMIETVEGQGCFETERSDFYFEAAPAVERRYDIARDTCTGRSEIQMWTFFKPGTDAVIEHESVSESIEVDGCHQYSKAREYYPNGQLKADIEMREGLVLEEKRYNEEGRRVSNPLHSSLNAFRADLHRKKCNRP